MSRSTRHLTTRTARAATSAGLAGYATFGEDLEEILGYPDPAHVRLPLGEVPTDPDDAVAYAERLSAQIALTAAGLELREQLRAVRLADAEMQAALERRRLELESAELENKALKLAVAEQELSVRQAAADADAALEYTFYEEVNEETVRQALKVLSTWSRREPNKEISIVLNSPGGTVVDGLALFDFILYLRKRGHWVPVTVLGLAASMGAVLLQAGSERIIGENGSVMMHEVRSGTMGPLSDLSDEMITATQMNDRLVDILASRSKLTARQIKTKWRRRDWWVPADEAVKLGFADRIL
jgi:ATP-dependent Clp endopeptidase proteolytic subunit ClpP